MNVLNIIIFINILIIKSQAATIQFSFFLCDQTDEIREFPENCHDFPTYIKISCEIFRNDINFFQAFFIKLFFLSQIFRNVLKIFSKFEDQFNFVDSPNGKIVIYNSYSNLYLASCIMIQEISIPEKVDKCTEDIPVIIQNENKIVYLTKQGMLRHHSKFKECIDEYEFMETHGSQIIRKSN